MSQTQNILYLSRADIETLDFRMVDIITAVEEAFKEKGAGRVEMPPKPGIHPPHDAFIHDAEHPFQVCLPLESSG